MVKSDMEESSKKVCEKRLREIIRELKKTKDGPMTDEFFCKKEYMNSMTLSDTRTKFKMRCHMFDVKWNYKSDPQNMRDLWRCDSCKSNIETQKHILWCPAYVDLRAGKNLKEDKDLIEYMKKVLSIREKLKIIK